MNGYAGKILRVNLTDREISAIATRDYDQWGGGHGIGSALFWDLVKDTNRYIEQEAPWNLAKSEDTWPRLETVLFNALEAVRIAALFTAPVMPNTSAEVWKRLGLGDIHAVTVTRCASVHNGVPPVSPSKRVKVMFTSPPMGWPRSSRSRPW